MTGPEQVARAAALRDALHAAGWCLQSFAMGGGRYGFLHWEEANYLGVVGQLARLGFCLAHSEIPETPTAPHAVTAARPDPEPAVTRTGPVRPPQFIRNRRGNLELVTGDEP